MVPYCRIVTIECYIYCKNEFCDFVGLPGKLSIVKQCLFPWDGNECEVEDDDWKKVEDVLCHLVQPCMLTAHSTCMLVRTIIPPGWPEWQ
jgi:hypothetical protein